MPVAGGRTLCHARNVKQLAAAIGHLVRPRSSQGMLILLEPSDPVVFDRMDELDGLPCVAPSQAAIDCLAGPDRTPVAARGPLLVQRAGALAAGQQDLAAQTAPWTRGLLALLAERRREP